MRWSRYSPERHPLALIVVVLFLIGASVVLSMLLHWPSPKGHENEVTVYRQKQVPSISRSFAPTPVPQIDPKTAREMIDRALEAISDGSASVLAFEEPGKSVELTEEQIIENLGLKKDPSMSALIVRKEEGYVFVVTEFLFPGMPPRSPASGYPPQGSFENPLKVFLGEKLTILVSDSRGTRNGTLQDATIGYVAQLSRVFQYQENRTGPFLYSLGVFLPGTLELYWRAQKS